MSTLQHEVAAHAFTELLCLSACAASLACTALLFLSLAALGVVAGFVWIPVSMGALAILAAAVMCAVLVACQSSARRERAARAVAFAAEEPSCPEFIP